MNAKLSRFLSWTVAVQVLLGAGTLGATDAMADDKYKYNKEYRRHDGQEYRHRDVNRDLNRHERDRRAFVAGAAVQQHRNDNRNYYRNDYRAGYADRYQDRYYNDRDDHDNKIGAALVGAAVGAVLTGVVMSNMNKDSDNSSNNNRQ
jgi:hypothetical protein